MSTNEPSRPMPPERNPLTLALDVIARPRPAFTYIRDQADRWWLLPLALVLMLTVLARLVAAPIERAQMEAAMARFSEQFGDPAVSGAPGFVVQGPGSASFSSDGGTMSNPALEYGLPLIRVLFDWGLTVSMLFGLAWLIGGRPNLAAMVRLSSWALLPTLARQVVALALMLSTGRLPITGLQSFAAPAEVAAPSEPGGDVVFVGPGGSNVLGSGPSFAEIAWLNFLSTLDAYRVWELVLHVIGVSVVARLSWLKALLPPLGLWAVSVFVATVPTLVMPLLAPLVFGGPVIGP